MGSEQSAEKLAYLEGMQAGAELAAKLAAMYEGQSDIERRITRAMTGVIGVYRSTMRQMTDCRDV